MNKTLPLVSIIIPSYQSAQFVTKAIDSCLFQSYSNIEIIVIDDGSTDDTKNILLSYINAKKIHYLYQENKGLSGARNSGLRIANGEYLQFLDADDTICPTKIDCQIEYLIHHTEDIGVYSDYVVQKENKIIHYQKTYPVGNLFNHVTYSSFVMPIHTVLLRNKHLPFFDETLQQGEDRDFWLNIFHTNTHTFGFINAILATYTLHDKNMTHQTEKNFLSMIQILNKHFLLGPDLQQPILQEATKYHYGLLGIYFIENTNYARARYYLLQSFSIKNCKYKLVFFISYLLSFIPILYQGLKHTVLWIRRNITHRRRSQNVSN
jgi:glycosyltransferase involved in cell wall biosynthesis